MSSLGERFSRRFRHEVSSEVNVRFLETLRQVPEATPTELVRSAAPLILPPDLVTSLARADAAHPKYNKVVSHIHVNARGDDGTERVGLQLIKLVAAKVTHVAFTGHDTLEPGREAEELIDEFDLPIENIPASEASIRGKRHLIVYN